MNKIFFHNSDKKSNIKNSKAINVLLSELFKLENIIVNRVDYIFCSDNYLLKINQQHLKHDTFTDIITFTLSEKNQPVAGEVYISIDRVKENAKKYKASYQNELLRVTIHGALHLCGYKDDSKLLKAEIHTKEDFYLHLYKFHVKQILKTNIFT